MLFPIIELQPLSYIRHTYMISITAVFIIQLIYKLLRQAAAVITDPDIKLRSKKLHGYLNAARLCHPPKSMIDGILNKRLQKQLVDPVPHQFLRHFCFYHERLVQLLLLQHRVTFQPGKLLPDAHHITRIADGIAQDICQRPHHIADLKIIVLQRLPVDGIQCIIQKMRIDLGLHSLQLRVFLIHRRLLYLLDQLL